MITKHVSALVLCTLVSAISSEQAMAIGPRGGKAMAQNETVAPTASPSASPAASPSASSSGTKPNVMPLPGQSAPPTRILPPTGAAPKADPKAVELKKHCDRHYPGTIQGELRSACASASTRFKLADKNLAQTRCRLNYGDEPRLAMACLVGVAVAADLDSKSDAFKTKLQICAEHYPQHTEIDAFLQESCLTGIHLPDVMAQVNGEGHEICGQISPERSFIGPCAVGLSLAREMSDPKAVRQQNKICEQYFDHRRFHLTYRSCLNAHSVVIGDSEKVEDLLKKCSDVVSDPGNDNERAACIVGSAIHRAATKSEDITKRFQKCGDNKVSYQDRDVLACLTAASLTNIADRRAVENGCKDVFKNAKSGSRSDCVNSISLF